MCTYVDHNNKKFYLKAFLFKIINKLHFLNLYVKPHYYFNSVQF
jgi:hypothetical protein